MDTPAIASDVVVIGGGAAGYTAGIYAARASLNVTVIEQGMPGGQAATTDVIENYPGIPSITGAELGQRLHDHAVAAGASSTYGAVDEITRTEDGSFLITAGSTMYQAPAVIAATGAQPRKAGFTGEDAFRGRGISYCATCDGMFYRNKDVFVIGGGNAACEEAGFLANIARSVTMVVRRDQFRAPKGEIDRLLAHENVSVRYSTSIIAVDGSNLLGRITFRNNVTGREFTETYPEGSFGIFVFTGNDPAVDLVRPYVDLGNDSGVITDENMATKTPGLFCAGDMRSKILRQVITAASDGAIAGMSAYHYVEAQR